MTTPMFVCNLCPVDDDAFYSKELTPFVKHLQTQHRLVPQWFYRDIPLERPVGVPMDKVVVPLRSVTMWEQVILDSKPAR